MNFILKSLLITACISTAAGFALRSILGFTEIFLLATIIQFLIFYYINLFFNKKTLAESLSANVDELTSNIDALVSRQEVQIDCPCGNSTIPVVLFMDEELLINCGKCKNKLKVTPEVSIVLVTEPINLENIEPIFDKLKRTNV
jgi:hypothetical protein